MLKFDLTTKGNRDSKMQYGRKFYEIRDELTRSSAEVVVPLVVKLMPVNSVIDVGCGVGTWLSVFNSMGISDIWGIEGSWLDKKHLVIPERFFSSSDLRLPFQLERTFDLAVSLEVAEHLPAECAETFIDSLVRLAPIILFSAACPGQGGDNHVNLQWQDYWADLFKRRGYEVVDCIRKKIWQDDRVLWWYVQNTLLFVQGDRLGDYPLLKKEHEATCISQLSIVHPHNYEKSVKRNFQALVQSVKDALKRRVSVILEKVNK